MKKLLVTGASGFLGWNLCNLAKSNWQVYGTYFTHQIAIAGVNLNKIDLQDLKALQQLLATTAPDAVIHTAAASKPNFCQTHPQESYAANVEVSVNIARLCAELEIPLVFTSTDLVFDGTQPPYKETDPISPICYYGEQKAIAEQKILEIYPAAAICRMPLMFGKASPTAASFLQSMVKNLQVKRELSLFIDEYRTPASATTASRGLLLAIAQRVSGLLHLGGRERISRYEFGLLLADILELSPTLITSCRQQDVAMAAPRSPDTSLDSSKAFALGYNPLPLREELSKLVVRQ